MALINESSNRTFVKIVNGKFAQTVSKDTKDAKHRVTKFGKDVWELYFDTLCGTFSDIRLDDPPEKFPQIGKQWAFVIEDGDDIYELKLPQRSIPAYGLLTRLMNVNYDQPVKIKVYRITGDDDVTRDYCVIHQEGEKIGPFFTKEVPNGLPALKQIVVNGEKAWDHTSRLKFFKKVVDEKILPKIKDANPIAETKLKPAPVEEEVPPPTEEDVPDYNESDDLPF